MKTLENKIIISTRPYDKNDIIRDYLTVHGAKVFEYPMIEIVFSEINKTITKIFNSINTYQWIIFTSKNGAEHFFRLLQEAKISLDKIQSTKIAVIGEKTANTVKSNGIIPYYISSHSTSDEFAKELSLGMIKLSDKVLLILGELAKNTLEKALSKIANITRLNIYKTVEDKQYTKEIVELISKDIYDLIIFTSPSGVNNFITIITENNCYKDLRLACIGQTTYKEILKHNQQALLVASKSEGLSFAKEIEKYLIGNLYSC